MELSADAARGVDVLVVEPEPESRLALQSLLGTLRVQWAETAAEGEELMRKKEFSLVICADDLPDRPGLMLLAATRDLRPATQRILMCRDLDAEVLLHALREGSVVHYLPKPFDPAAAERLILHALDQCLLMENLLTARSRLDRAETRLAGIGPAERRSNLLSKGALRLFVIAALGILLMFAMVFVGFSALYLLKSALRIDVFPNSHLQDFLPR